MIQTSIILEFVLNFIEIFLAVLFYLLNVILEEVYRKRKMKEYNITTLFLDIGGVILTNGWGYEARSNAVTNYKLDNEELNERNHLTFDTYEEDKLTLSKYLKRVVFYELRSFSKNEFIVFMFKQSLPILETINYFKKIKKRYNLRVITVSNEGKELNPYLIKQFKLNELFDAYVSSSFVYLRKPDTDIFQVATDISQTLPEHSNYIDDRHMFVEVAQTLGMNDFHYQGLEISNNHLDKLGFSVDNSFINSDKEH